MAKIMMTLHKTLISYITLITILSISIFPSTIASNEGFTIDLIHRDSPQSPSHDPSLTPSQRLANALRRSFARVHRFKPKNGPHGSPESDVINSNGEYLMKYSIGTPPVQSLAIADTGSDTIWTQCQPCQKCFKQKLPFFIPKKSSTYKKISCKSGSCGSITGTSCSPNKRDCLYQVGYGDGSGTNGQLAMDTITLGSSTRGKRPFSFRNIIFGCGYNNGGIFNGGESGLVGLGGGKASLIRQLGPLAKGKFSYCLTPLSNASTSSKLNFGANALVSGRGVVSTPLVKKYPETYYYLTLEAISVGKHKLGLNQDINESNKAIEEGNIIIDSGTTLTLIPLDLYDRLESALKRVIKKKQINDPQGVLKLCFDTREELQIPDFRVYFKGANVKLKTENVFIRVSENVLCLAFQPVEGLSIYGNIAQTNFLVGYDLVKKTVSFKAKDCSK